ncbi:MAG: spermidine/putrescine transport system permease protein [Chthoniobacter sp.]|jgi:spermidine/putrescine transport system permease protein|nr:spermidine/putrescine transport system permease protein [Chthoniobacter sp.]
MNLVNLLCGWWSALVFIFLYVPIVLLIVYSFNASELSFLWGGFSLEWYARLWQSAPLIDSLNNSLIVAAATTLLSVVLGTAGAWLLYRYRYPGLRALRALIFIPMVIPEVIMGVSLLIFFTALTGPLNRWLALFTETEFGLGYATIIIAHTTFCFPFVLVAVQARLAGVDPNLEEAAMDLGAPPLKAFWLVMVPYLLPAIVSGALMSFTLSLDEYIVTVFVTGPASQTLPIKVFGMAKKGLDPSLNAISAVIVLATAVFVVLAEGLRKLNR